MFSDTDIDLCVSNALQNVRTNGINELRVHDLNQHESLVEIKGSRVTVLCSNPEQCQHRFNHTLCWLRKAAEGLDLNCLLVIALGDLAGRQSLGPFHTGPIYTPYSRFCFSAIPGGLEIPIPDPNIPSHFNWSPRMHDTMASRKFPFACFVGASTGRINPSGLNQRIEFCHKCINTPVLSKITYFYDLFSDKYLAERGITKKEIYSYFIHRRDQLKYSIILDIDGNTNSWDRVAWGFATQSMVAHLQSEDCPEKSWYHPLIEAGQLLPTFSSEQILSGITYNKDLSENQQLFSKDLLDAASHEEYLRKVIHCYDSLYRFKS